MGLSSNCGFNNWHVKEWLIYYFWKVLKIHLGDAATHFLPSNLYKYIIKGTWGGAQLLSGTPQVRQGSRRWSQLQGKLVTDPERAYECMLWVVGVSSGELTSISCWCLRFAFMGEWNHWRVWTECDKWHGWGPSGLCRIHMISLVHLSGMPKASEQRTSLATC